MLRALPICASVLLVACGGGGSDAASFSGGSTDASSDTGADANDTADGTSNPPAYADAAWYAIDAQLDLVAGEVRLGPESWVRVRLLDSALGAICEHDVGITAAQVEPQLPDDPAELGWWRFDLLDGAPDRDPCPAWSARSIRLGVGPYDPRLDPVLAGQQTAEGESLYDTALYALFLQEVAGGPRYVLGVVTMPGLETADLLTAPPLADGTYEARSLVLLPFADG